MKVGTEQHDGKYILKLHTVDSRMRQTVLTFIFGRSNYSQPRGVDGASLLTCDSKHVSVTAGTNIHVISPYF